MPSSEEIRPCSSNRKRLGSPGPIRTSSCVCETSVNARGACEAAQRFQAVDAILTHRVNPPAALILMEHDSLLPTRHGTVRATNLRYEQTHRPRGRVPSDLHNRHASVGNRCADASLEIGSNLKYGRL